MYKRQLSTIVFKDICTQPWHVLQFHPGVDEDALSTIVFKDIWDRPLCEVFTPKDDPNFQGDCDEQVLASWLPSLCAVCSLRCFAPRRSVLAPLLPSLCSVCTALDSQFRSIRVQMHCLPIVGRSVAYVVRRPSLCLGDQRPAW